MRRQLVRPYYSYASRNIRGVTESSRTRYSFSVLSIRTNTLIGYGGSFIRSKNHYLLNSVVSIKISLKHNRSALACSGKVYVTESQGRAKL